MLTRCTRQAARRATCSIRQPSVLATKSRVKSSYVNLSNVPSTRKGFLRPATRYGLLFCIVAGSGVGYSAYPWNQDQTRQSLFNAYTLIKTEPISPTASIFHLQPQENTAVADAYKTIWSRGIWNIQIKQPQLQIVRAYTPLPPQISPETNVESSKGDLRFLIRHDPHGEVSNYLHRLPHGARIDLRGPYLEYELPLKTRHVVFLAGGTGIAPALQVAHAMFGNENSDDHATAESKQGKLLHIMWASRDRTDCSGGQSDTSTSAASPGKSFWFNLFPSSLSKAQPIADGDEGLIVQELEMLKQRYPGKIVVDYFVDSEGTFINRDAISEALLTASYIRDSLNQASDSTEPKEIIISGPPGFISALAGAKEWKNGREEQGPIGGIMAQVLSKGFRNVNVWKV